MCMFVINLIIYDSETPPIKMYCHVGSCSWLIKTEQITCLSLFFFVFLCVCVCFSLFLAWCYDRLQGGNDEGCAVLPLLQIGYT